MKFTHTLQTAIIIEHLLVAIFFLKFLLIWNQMTDWTALCALFTGKTSHIFVCSKQEPLLLDKETFLF